MSNALFFGVSSTIPAPQQQLAVEDEGHFRKLAQCGITVWVFRLEHNFFVMPKMLKGRKDKSETFARKMLRQKNLKNDLVIHRRIYRYTRGFLLMLNQCAIFQSLVPYTMLKFQYLSKKVDFDKILFDFLTKCGLLEYCNPKGIWESWFVWKLKVFSAWCQLPFSATPPQKRQNILIYQFIQLAFRI